METFSALLAIWEGNSPVPGAFPTQRPVTWSFDVFFGVRLNKRLSNQWWGWWFETLSRPLWRHRNERKQSLVHSASPWGVQIRHDVIEMTVITPVCVTFIMSLYRHHHCIANVYIRLHTAKTNYSYFCLSHPLSVICMIHIEILSALLETCWELYDGNSLKRHISYSITTPAARCRSDIAYLALTAAQETQCRRNKITSYRGWPLLWDTGNGFTVYPKKYAHGFCFAVLCCGYTLTDFPISIRLTSLALWQSNDCPSASKATLMNMDKYFMWIHYERLHNHNKAKHNKTVCIFLGIYCTLWQPTLSPSVMLCLSAATWICRWSVAAQLWKLQTLYILQKAMRKDMIILTTFHVTRAHFLFSLCCFWLG